MRSNTMHFTATNTMLLTAGAAHYLHDAQHTVSMLAGMTEPQDARSHARTDTHAETAHGVAYRGSWGVLRPAEGAWEIAIS